MAHWLNLCRELLQANISNIYKDITRIGNHRCVWSMDRTGFHYHQQWINQLAKQRNSIGMYGVNSVGCIGFMGCILLGTLVVFGLCIVWSVYGTKYYLIFMQTHILCIVFGAYIRSDVKRAHIGNIVQGTYAANTMHLIYEIHCIGSMYQVHYVGSTY